MNFEKFQVNFWPSFFKRKQIKIKMSLIFYFASSDTLKAVTGCFEKLEISAKRIGLKTHFK